MIFCRTRPLCVRCAEGDGGQASAPLPTAVSSARHFLKVSVSFERSLRVIRWMLKLSRS